MGDKLEQLKTGQMPGEGGPEPKEKETRCDMNEKIVQTSTKAKFFLYEEDPMYSKRESELIQDYLREHGCMPPGEGEDDLDDLF